MKSEDALLIELRESLSTFAASKMTMQRVEAREYRLVDHQFYDRIAARLSNCGFVLAGDFNPVTGHPSDGSMRCFVRAFLSDNGSYTAACYHPRPKFWIGLISRLICGRLGKVMEMETEFADDTWIVTTTAPKVRLFDPPPLLLREHHPEQIEVESLFNIHKRRVQAYVKANPGVAIRKVSDVTGLERSQARQHDISTAYRKMVGGLKADEIRRFSVFGKARSEALKSRLDELGQDTRNDL